MTIDGQTIFVTAHAVERFRDRCRPALSIEQARKELNRLLTDCAHFGHRPDWSRTAGLRHGTHAWVLLGEHVLFPVLNDRLTTCLVPGDLHPTERAKRRQRRIDRQARRFRDSKRRDHRPETEAA